MNVCVVLDHRFSVTPDGLVWTDTSFDSDFWLRYLAAFESVTVIARVQRVGTPPEGALRADRAAVSFVPIPYYIGVGQFVRRLPWVLSALGAACPVDSALVLRVPTVLANMFSGLYLGRSRPYAVEVVGDSWDAFSPGASVHPLRSFLRRWFDLSQRQQCRRAVAASYVTRAALQRRYPPGPGAFTTHASTIDLHDSAFVTRPRSFADLGGRPARLVTVGSLEHLYKAPDLLLESVAGCIASGRPVELTIVGGGRMLPCMERLAADLGISSVVTFRGTVPMGDAVRAELDRSDLFVLPSRQEGLPRALIEAMARALPCVGTTVGGIPELLDRADCVPPNDARALTRRILEMLSDVSTMEDASRRNLATALDYRSHSLQERRAAFYRALRAATESWLRSAGTSRATP